MRLIWRYAIDDADAGAMPSVDDKAALPGRVLRLHGLYSVVETEDGRQYRCVVRRVLRTLATDERSVVTTGDRVWFLPAGPAVKERTCAIRITLRRTDRSTKREAW